MVKIKKYSIKCLLIGYILTLLPQSGEACASCQNALAHSDQHSLIQSSAPVFDESPAFIPIPSLRSDKTLRAGPEGMYCPMCQVGILDANGNCNSCDYTGGVIGGETAPVVDYPLPLLSIVALYGYLLYRKRRASQRTSA